jgi:asparagine synthase (glutamine-hydrolysing)
VSLIAFVPGMDPSGRWSARIHRHEPCPGASRVAALADFLVLAWGEPQCLPDLADLSAKVAVGDAGPLVGSSWIHLDRRTGRIDVAVDRYGAFPVLVGRGRSGPVVANHPLAMAQALGTRAEVDEAAVLQLLGLGQLTGQRSSLRDVEHLTANAHLVMHDRARTCTASPPELGHGPRSTPRQALDALVAAVDVRLRAAPDAILPLSGGLDSRVILAAALASGHRPDCLVYGAKESADVVLARDLAASAGVHLDVGLFCRAGVRRAAGAIAELGGGIVPLQHGFGLYDDALLARTRGRPLLTGTGAETFRAFYWGRGIPGCGFLGLPALRGLTHKTAARWAREHFERTLGPFSDILPEAGAALRAELDGLVRRALADARDAAHGLDALYLGERVRRFVIGGQQLLDRDHARLHPFLDAGVVDRLSRLHPRHRLHGRFARWAVQRLAPALADVRWDVTMRPMRAGLAWRERWPGLADRAGLQGIWAKRGQSIACDPQWLPALDGATFDLSPALARLGIMLSDTACRRHAEGVLGAWTGWAGAVRRLRSTHALQPAVQGRSGDRTGNTLIAPPVAIGASPP